MNIIVTGGAGFIGSHIVDLLVENNHSVMIIDDLSTGEISNINQKATFINKDILDNLEYEFKEFRPDYVIHHAAQVDVNSSMIDPISDSKSNIVGTINLLNHCVKYNTKKIVYASSAAIYGVPEYLSIDEKHPITPLSCYGISKFTPEQYIKTYSTLYDFDYTILRYSNVYGERQSSKGEGGVVSIFLNKLLSGEVPVIHGDGEQTRDFIYVKDVARANYSALFLGSKKTCNISTNTRISIKALYAMLTESMGIKKIEPISTTSRVGDILHSVLDNKLAFHELDWSPKYSVEQGIEEIVKYYKRNVSVNL
ncbi:UDP-glucose 4-epimerase [Paenibacillus castaneae]|uniref:NAD-dependent epimerase/dehydratase family protein n=1 Tax=Paenibacillus castaneae TaxID=474957 RepID=UPI000C9CE1F7|nr:NAD-dependent epimerase/dehydratase family protein [Paenibacillus castaneae]NIK78350.1 UDP-glucose 4-epimerase [Paenibacillus castaneae]